MSRVSVEKHLKMFIIFSFSCNLPENPRQVEVKLKCKRSDSPSTVSLYLLEPKTCEYVLGVESPLVCDIIHLADDDGLMEFGRNDFVAMRAPEGQPVGGKSAET